MSYSTSPSKMCQSMASGVRMSVLSHPVSGAKRPFDGKRVSWFLWVTRNRHIPIQSHFIGPFSFLDYESENII